MTVNQDLDALVAEIYEGLGDPRARAARANACTPEDLTAERDGLSDLVDAIEALVCAVPESSRTLKHDDACHQRHVTCLADRILALISPSD